MALLLAALGAPALGQWRDWDTRFDEEARPWQEIQAQIPPYPRSENLVALEAGNTSGHRFYIDASSVSVGEDEVIRYTTVVRTAGGATNVMFEGMRCETRERKLYAVGRNDGSWMRARDTQWQRIELRETAPHHYVLYREYFCPQRVRPASARQAVDALRRAARGITVAD